MPRVIIRRGALIREHTPAEIYEQVERLNSEWQDVPWLQYAVQEGYVTSAFDGDQHHITYTDLIRLYRVNPNRCFRVRPITQGSAYLADMEFSKANRLILLRPDPTGMYLLENCRRIE